MWASRKGAIKAQGKEEKKLKKIEEDKKENENEEMKGNESSSVSLLEEKENPKEQPKTP